MAVGVNATISDSKGNTWTQLTARIGTGFNGAGRIWYAENPTVGSSHTFTANASGTCYPSLAASAWSGTETSSVFDQENSAINDSSPASPGSITPSENDELVFAACANGISTSVPSINSGFTIVQAVGYDNNVALGVGAAYIIQTSASAVNPAWSIASGSIGATFIASFKAAAGGGGGSNFDYPRNPVPQSMLTLLTR